MEQFVFSSTLREWFSQSARPLPWRDTKDPYKIWLSEVILQQTRVNQGLAYYHSFTEKYPDVASLAHAGEDEVLRLWQGLGYYSRARNLMKAAKQVMEEFNGQFPPDYLSLRQLKGVGDYTAAAIASFAFGLPNAVVDGNVFRFLSRFAGIYTPVDSLKGKKEVARLAHELLDPSFAGEHNQAMMEMGATVCKPAQPLCDSCPFYMSCHAFLNDAVQDLPVKEKKQKVERRHMVYFFVTDGKFALVRKRVQSGIWQGLYEFPGYEAQKDPGQSIPELPLSLQGLEIESVGKSRRMRHLLSHRELIVDFWKLNTMKIQNSPSAFEKVPISALVDFAFPRLFTRFFEEEQVY